MGCNSDEPEVARARPPKRESNTRRIIAAARESVHRARNLRLQAQLLRRLRREQRKVPKQPGD